eukprot:scaffold4655_cov115-Isochrysis_galbana.AAC.10
MACARPGMGAGHAMPRHNAQLSEAGLRAWPRGAPAPEPSSHTLVVRAVTRGPGHAPPHPLHLLPNAHPHPPMARTCK